MDEPQVVPASEVTPDAPVETRNEMEKRWRREDRFKDCEAWLLHQSKAYQQLGRVAKKVADAQAVADARLKFPPLAEKPPVPLDVGRIEPAKKKRKKAPLPWAGRQKSSKLTPEEKAYFRALDGKVDVKRDFEWAYAHLDDEDAVPREAPSLTAWSQLTWGRANRDAFLAQAHRQVKPREEKQEGLDSPELLADRKTLNELIVGFYRYRDRIRSEGVEGLRLKQLLEVHGLIGGDEGQGPAEAPAAAGG